MLALVLAMLLCVALGAGVVGYVMIGARREGRGQFWTPEGEELIAGARRRGEQVRSRGEQLGRSAAERTQSIRQQRRPAQAETAEAPATSAPAASAPAAGAGSAGRGSGPAGAADQGAAGSRAETPVAPGSEATRERDDAEDGRAEQYRAAS
ncbi:hypothetical protein [Serinicoccus chungangensis]|uniref:hypothetical protein n=1 Tax=Serinicoccus chungangensis TaxID=767452 RepID=UPI001118DE06|nr:hypothetical protein [Serinicoccus chungangensis]